MSLLNKIFRWIDRLFGKPKPKSFYKQKGARKKRQSESSPKKTVRGASQLKRTPVKNNNKQRASVNKMKANASRTTKVKNGPARLKNVAKKPENNGKPIGEVTHYFDKIKVCVVRIDVGMLKKGDRILISGKGSELIQTVDSMQIENEDVVIARKGQLVGLKVKEAVIVGSKINALGGK